MEWDKGLPGWHLREYVVSGRGAHPPCPALRGRAPHPPASRPPRLLLTWGPSQRGSASLPHEAPRETRTEVGEAHAGCGAGRREAGQHASRPRAPQCPSARHTALVSADRQVQWSQFQGSDRRAFPGLGALLRSDTPLPRSLALPEPPPSSAGFQRWPPLICPHWPEGPSKTKPRRVPPPVSPQRLPVSPGV